LLRRDKGMEMFFRLFMEGMNRNEKKLGREGETRVIEKLLRFF
jgi:hypothetical protein